MFGITSGKKGGGFWPPYFSSDAKINHSYLTTKHLANIYPKGRFERIKSCFKSQNTYSPF